MTKNSTSVRTESNKVDTPQCKEEDMFYPPFLSADIDENPEHKSHNENFTAPDIFHSEVPAADNQSRQHFNDDNIKVNDDSTNLGKRNYPLPEQCTSVNEAENDPLPNPPTTNDTANDPLPNQTTSENKSKRESVELIVIEGDDEDIQTHLNSDVSHSHIPDVKTDATGAKREFK